MSKSNLPTERSSSREVDAFLAKAARLPAVSQANGRMIFAIDATMSRQATWDRAASIQTEMFSVAEGIGGLAGEVVYFRGFCEFPASEWTTSAPALSKRLQAVTCISRGAPLCRGSPHPAG